MVYFKENYTFPRFQHFLRVGGGGGPTFFPLGGGGGPKMLISIETYRTYDFPGGEGLDHLSPSEYAHDLNVTCIIPFTC